MAHWRPKIIVPVRSVQTIAFVEIHDIRNVREKITGTMHVPGTDLDIDLVLSRHSGRKPGTCGDDKGINNRVAFIGIHTLIREIHIDPALTVSTGILPGPRARVRRIRWSAYRQRPP